MGFEIDPKVFPHQPVKLSQKVEYHCTQCGNCCRHVKNAVMIESLDAFRMARHFREIGEPVQTIEQILTHYTESVRVTALGYPFFMMKVDGAEQSCIFLKDNRCSIQPVKPRTCRLYPFSAGPGEKGRPFSYYRCLEQEHHFTGGVVSVNDWVHQFFSKEDREFVTAEFKIAPMLGSLMGNLAGMDELRVLTPIVCYKYLNFDLDQPFLPQYHRNNKWLLKVLKGMAK